MDGERDGLDRAPRYSGEDTRPTSKKELSGWYSYGWAAEVFVVCGVGMPRISLRRWDVTKANI